MTTRLTVCIVCTVEADEAVMAVCVNCGDWYHLNPYATRPGIDCGIAALGDEEMGINYICNTCLGAIQTAAWEEQQRQMQAQHELTHPAPTAATPPPPASTPPRRRFRRVDP